MAVLSAIVPASLVPAGAAAIDFRGDWEQAVTGTQPPVPWEALEYGGQFDGSPAISEQLQIVTAPVRQGNKAAKFVVHPGDKYGGSSGERALARWLASDEDDGEEFYYGWSTLFPTDWTGESGWQIITEWHTDQRFPIPPVRLDAKTNSLSLWITAGQCYLNGSTPMPCQYDQGHTLLTNLNKGRWNDFIVRVTWQKSATGAVQVWHRVEGQTDYTLLLDLDGVPTLPWRNGDNDPADIYVLHGLYRNDTNVVNTLYHDNFVRGTTWTDVAATFPDLPTTPPPAPPPAPPSPAPSPAPR
ncbi:MAG: polysaccharide lyase, partial [Myxococcota bacterium]